MLVTYTPEGQESQTWDFNPGRVRQSEGAIIERQYGENWDKFCADVQAGSIRARRVLLWHLMRRHHPTMRFEDTPDFYADEVVLEHSLAELHAIRERITKAGLPDTDTEMALAIIDGQIAEAEGRAELGGDSGKATLNSEH